MNQKDRDALDRYGSRYPGATWTVVPSPSVSGWSEATLAEARRFSDQIGSDAVIIVDRGVVVQQWGEVARKHIVQSVRKSVLSALYGIYGEQGVIDLEATLASLDIDDHPGGLTEAEKQATVGELLMGRSGVYHKAAAESQRIIEGRPPRGSHAPGTFWCYNNWDCNALGTIFEQRTSLGIYDAIERHLAAPLQMQDFTAEDGAYFFQTAFSQHPAYHFDMSARDMARFGLLFLRRGRWRDHQLISEAWIDQSTRAYSDADDGKWGYGYMWWIGKPEAFGGHALVAAIGGKGHAIYIVPGLDVVVVHRIERSNFVHGWDEVDHLLVMILKAHPRSGNNTLIQAE